MFAIKAADSLSVWHAMLSMFIFSLGTFLPLFLVGFFSQHFLNSDMRRVLLYIAFVIMSYFAFSNVYKGVQLLQGHNPMHHESHDSMSHEKHNDTQMPDIDSNSHSHHHENHNDETKNYENQYMHHNMSEITKHEIHTMKHEN